MDLTIAPRRAALRLAGVALLLAAAGTVGYLGQYATRAGTLPARFFEALRQLFRLNAEGNISSWYATALLLGCALLLACIAGGTATARMPFARHWWGLAAIFVFLSLDEAISIHESFDGWAQTALGTRGLLLYAWAIPYALFALAVALAYLRLLLSLPRTIRLVFLLAGAVYVGGAVGFEPIQGYITTIQGRQGGVAHAATVAVEEVLEMLGAVLFIYGLLTHLATQRAQVRFGALPRGSVGEAASTGSTGRRLDVATVPDLAAGMVMHDPKESWSRKHGNVRRV